MIRREQQRHPTRFDFQLGPRLYSDALRRLHDETADANPVDPEFSDCLGDRGHPGMVATGDVVAPDAVIMAGEIGGACRVSCVAPAWMRR